MFSYFGIEVVISENDDSFVHLGGQDGADENCEE
jgi:hypothetical protein